MPRSLTFKVPTDSGLFSPIGLQPTAVFRLAFNASGRWLSKNAISHRRLVIEHHTGFVIWSAQLIAGQPIGFSDGDCLEFSMMARVRGQGTQFECEGELCSSEGRAYQLQACCVPLRLDGEASLSGIPARLSDAVLAAFRPDEIESAVHRSPVPALRAAIDGEGTLLARGLTSFTIHRHQCEVADQWFWPEAASLASGAREDLVRTEVDGVPLFRLSLATPAHRLDLVFHRPFFLFDEGVVRTSAWDWQGRLVFVHELTGAGEDEPRAVVIEQFKPSEAGPWH